MHPVAQKMIDEYDPSKHIRFALPFIRAMATEFGMDTALLWGAELLNNAIDQNEPEAASLEIASSALALEVKPDLQRLDERAWKHWCCGACPTFKMQKSISRFIWAAIAYISHHNDIHFESDFVGLVFAGASEEQMKFISLQTTSALNLAYDLDQSPDNALRYKIAEDFSREMERLGRA